jgi:hypothetical protein
LATYPACLTACPAASLGKRIAPKSYWHGGGLHVLCRVVGWLTKLAQEIASPKKEPPVDLSKTAAAFIRSHEGFVARRYLDPVDVPTIGIGFTWRS